MRRLLERNTPANIAMTKKLLKQQQEKILLCVPDDMKNSFIDLAWLNGVSDQVGLNNLQQVVDSLATALADYGDGEYREGFEDAKNCYAGED